MTGYTHSRTGQHGVQLEDSGGPIPDSIKLPAQCAYKIVQSESRGSAGNYCAQRDWRGVIAAPVPRADSLLAMRFWFGVGGICRSIDTANLFISVTRGLRQHFMGTEVRIQVGTVLDLRVTRHAACCCFVVDLKCKWVACDYALMSEVALNNGLDLNTILPVS